MQRDHLYLVQRAIQECPDCQPSREDALQASRQDLDARHLAKGCAFFQLEGIVAHHCTDLTSIVIATQATTTPSGHLTMAYNLTSPNRRIWPEPSSSAW